jgi:Pentapeptide repeats (8 copies)
MMDTARQQEQRKQQQIEGIGQKALNLAENTDDLDKLSKGVEVAKVSAEAARAYSRMDRIQFWVATIAPLATVLVAVVAILFQNHQNQAALQAQADHFLQSAKLQQEASEDAQWRDALKGVSFDDSSHVLAGALGMIGFFDMDRHAKDARIVAATLSPMIDIVAGFDNVLTALDDHTTNENQKDIIGVAQNACSIEWRLFKQSSYSRDDVGIIPFFFFQGGEFDVDYLKASVKRTTEEKLKIGAYEVDTASHALWVIWKRGWPKPKASPEGQNLRNLVLEAYDFSDLDFSNAKLDNSLVADVRFKGAKFRGATFTEARLISSERGKNPLASGVMFDDADLCDVTSFFGSNWSGANWWTAKCISPELYDFLLKNFRPPSADDVRKASTSARH